MEMDRNNAVNQIVCLTMQYNNAGNCKSIYTLLQETGYFELHSQILECDIHEAVTQHPECVHQWLAWSEDKRTDGGWYFQQDERGKYIVGLFAPEEGSSQRTEYSDANSACAAFIKHEIESIRGCAK